VAACSAEAKALGVRVGMPSAEATGLRVAEILGGEDGPATLAEMRAASAADVLAAYGRVEYSPFTREGYQWAPNVDGHVIPDDPIAMYRSGRQHDVPLIVGMNGNEGSLFSRNLGIDDVGKFQAMVRNAIPEQASQALEHFAVATDEDVVAAMDHWVHDLYFAGPVRLHALTHAEVSSPAWLYHFTRVPPTSRAAVLGSHHTSEIRYVFGNLTGPGTYTQPLAAEGEEPSDVDKRISDTMMSYWVQFAKTGNPNVEGQPVWPEYEPATDTYLEIGEEMRTGTGLHQPGFELFNAVEAWKRAGM